MSTPLKRIAYVRLSENGTSYPMLCPREDLDVDDEVEVLLRPHDSDSTYMDGTITGVTWQRWDCRSQVLNHRSEVSYTIDDTDGFKWIRQVDLTRGADNATEQAERKWTPYSELSTRDEMLEMYDAVAGEDGEDAYLGDGVLIRPDGSVKSRD
jgi:hypothetical protein